MQSTRLKRGFNLGKMPKRKDLVLRALPCSDLSDLQYLHTFGDCIF